MADLRDRFRAFIAEHALLAPGQRAIAAVSGGVDSIVLLHLLREDYAPLAAHVHHGLREDADEDAAFVGQLAAAWGLEARVVRVTVETGASRQGRARRARYRALRELALAEGIGTVAVAQHRDDVAETVLLQLLRGAGPAGWAAMPIRRPLGRDSGIELVRPVRFASRAEILAYARAHEIPWREDASNRDPRYRRTFVRQRVMPLLRRGFGEGAADRLAAAAELAEAYVASGAALAPEEALRGAMAEPGALSVEVLAAMPAVVRRGVILAFLARQSGGVPRSANAVREVEDLLGRQPGRRAILGEVTVWRERDVLRFAFTESAPPAFVAGVPAEGVVHTPCGELVVTPLADVPTAFPESPLAEVADVDALQPPVLLRTWRDGDSLVPHGMTGRKRVSDLLTERRVPPSERGKQLVLEAGGQILWVVGHRLAAAAAVTASTRGAVHLTWNPTAA
jgi:tRNA(Ile)-lysidine synthase